MAADKPEPGAKRPLKVGDRVRLRCADGWLDGQVGRVIGLAVRSAQGFTGIAVQYSALGYSVMRPEEVELVGTGGGTWP